jgi:transcriptional regulator with XRE-family HTH domain
MPLTEREKAALQDPDVRFGFDNSEVLAELGEFIKSMRTEAGMTQQALQNSSGIAQADISRLESGAAGQGPLLMTLVRLVRGSKKRLVIGIADDDKQEFSRVLTL